MPNRRADIDGPFCQIAKKRLGIPHGSHYAKALRVHAKCESADHPTHPNIFLFDFTSAGLSAVPCGNRKSHLVLLTV